MDSGRTARSEITTLLVSQTRAFCRIATVCESDTERAAYVEVHVNEPPRGWVEERWRYSTGAFIATLLSGSDAAALVNGDGLLLEDLCVSCAAVDDDASTRRHPSHTKYGLHQPSHPITRHELRIADPPQVPQEWRLLVSEEGAPSFGSYPDAFSAFFRYADPYGNNRLPNAQIVITVAETDAWFEKITLTPTMLSVTIAGPRTNGARLELNSPSLIQDTRVDGPGYYTFVLPEDLAGGALLVLSGDGRWYDYRQLGRFLTSDDPSIERVGGGSELESLIYAGEGSGIEFKSELPRADKVERSTMLKTVAAFANGGGGTLLFGVADDGTIVGLDVSDFDDAIQWLTNVVQDSVDPPPAFDITAIQREDVIVLALDVAASTMVHALGRERPEFYVRRAASTFPARRDELVALIQARTQRRDGNWFP